MKTSTPTRYRYSPSQELGRNCTHEEMERNIARYADLEDDVDIFPDIKAEEIGARKHYHVISPGSHLGPSRITTPHNFHMSYVVVPAGHGARLHAHRLPEVFIVMKGIFQIIWGNQGENSIELGPLDTVSVPVNVMRTFRNAGNEEGILQVIYDGPGEVLGEIFVRPSSAEKGADE